MPPINKNGTKNHDILIVVAGFVVVALFVMGISIVWQNTLVEIVKTGSNEPLHQQIEDLKNQVKILQDEIKVLKK
ncbi:MAG: hypothetical protein HY453_02335 [Parcubacteria group bacterium]|nr:hypothetical protein [Parcubacteria group bacterium]